VCVYVYKYVEGTDR